ncbi:hypothetical protein [Nocardia sp. NPDC003963]
MTSPNLNFDDTPVTRYIASVAVLSEGNPVSTPAEDHFLDPSQAREWVRRQLRAQRRSGTVRVNISDTIAQPHLASRLYSLEGPAEQVARALEDLRVPTVVRALASGAPFNAAAEFGPLAQLYEQVTAEAARVKWDGALAGKREGLRHDLRLTADRMVGTDRDRAAAIVASIDLVPLARPTGAYTALLDSAAGGAPGVGSDSGDQPTRPLAVRRQQFDSARHAREWLGAQCGILGAEAGQVQALIVQNRADGTTVTVRSEAGRPTDVATRLGEQVDYDGSLVTGVAGVDRDRLASLVEAYQEAANDSPAFQPVSASPGAFAATRIGLAPSRYSRLGTEIAEMVTDPRMIDQLPALRPVLAAADAHQTRGPNAVSDIVGCPSSGFVQADLQIALDQHHLLQSELASKQGPEQRRLAALAGEVRARIDALLPSPLLTATERIAVREDVQRAIETPMQGYSPVFQMPAPAAIRQRADELLDAPFRAGPDGRGADVDALLRLHQLTRVAAERGSNREREALRPTLLDQRMHLEPRISNHPHLTGGEKVALRQIVRGLGQAPQHEIPTQRAEYVAAPIPAERMEPPAQDTVDTYTIGFKDPRNPNRELILRAAQDRWTVQAYQGYEAHPHLRRSEGAANFPNVDAMLSSLHAGAVVTSTEGSRRRIDPVEVPARVRDLLGQAQRLQRSQSASSGTETARTQSPQAAAVVRQSPEQRRQAMLARPKRPAVGRHRKLG